MANSRFVLGSIGGWSLYYCLRSLYDDLQMHSWWLPVSGRVLFYWPYMWWSYKSGAILRRVCLVLLWLNVIWYTFGCLPVAFNMGVKLRSGGNGCRKTSGDHLEFWRWFTNAVTFVRSNVWWWPQGPVRLLAIFLYDQFGFALILPAPHSVALLSLGIGLLLLVLVFLSVALFLIWW